MEQQGRRVSELEWKIETVCKSRRSFRTLATKHLKEIIKSTDRQAEDRRPVKPYLPWIMDAIFVALKNDHSQKVSDIKHIKIEPVNGAKRND